MCVCVFVCVAECVCVCDSLCVHMEGRGIFSVCVQELLGTYTFYGNCQNELTH